MLRFGWLADDDVNGDRMRVNDFSDACDGWNININKPCLKEISCVHMCCPLKKTTKTKLNSFLLRLLVCVFTWWMWRCIEAVYTVRTQTGEGHLTLLPHWKVRDISCHSIGNESYRDWSISVVQRRVSVAYAHICKTGAGHQNKLHKSDIFFIRRQPFIEEKKTYNTF